VADTLVIATAGLKPDQLADTDHIKYPRVDYLELQRFLDADLLNYGAYDHSRWGNIFRRLETSLRTDLYLTLLGLLRERHYRLVFAMSERTGIPFASARRMLPRRRPLVSMNQCWSWRQESAFMTFGLFSSIDAMVVHCQSMKDNFMRLGAPGERVHIIPYGVDHRFFAPLPDVEQQPGLIMSLGEVRSRDYGTLFKAVDGLSLKLLVAASGIWYAREKDRSINAQVPENTITSGNFSQVKLRSLYAQSHFTVLPLYDTVFSAGATATLESMCMGRPVIATRSRGIVDFVIDGETGILVEPGDAAAMREAIQDLLAHPEEARRLGRNARQLVEEELNLDIYVERIARLLQSFL
jgi:glycosyltransferase involved in cell wall biosynthesis